MVDMADLISRSALMRHIENEYREWGEEYDALQILGDIEDAPAAETEPVRRGAWRHYEGTLTCLICGAEFDDGIMEYCGDDVPHRCLECGAIMDGEESEDGEIR